MARRPPSSAPQANATHATHATATAATAAGRCPWVHMVGMRYAIDAAVVDREGRVLVVRTLRPWVGLTGPRWRANATVEAAAGAMATWGVRTGSVLSPDRQ